MVFGRAAQLPLYLNGIGSLAFVDVQMSFEVTDGGARAHGRIGAVWPACDMARTQFPTGTGQSVLDVFTNVYKAQLDIDRDHDGTERIVGDGEVVTGCIDGDGTGSRAATAPAIRASPMVCRPPSRAAA